MRQWAHLAQRKPSVHGNVYCYSGNMGLSTEVPTASSRQAAPAPMDREGWQKPAPRQTKGLSLGSASFNSRDI